ncbi:hypothetical protein MSG28_011058 [Choristoneura fumiferana]|uniref:Uncharacterized protein n=1 Tax=Choristoneura fumiferana TaxID=7141 RepID=A0ACC0KQS8_CHOFU|nr:hypothetical protein MSG28_011058 [Choristoneura fumiferana]
MSQSRTRRAGSGAREPARPSGDIGPNPQQRHRSTNRNKIPKSIRYDLENALLGNNIKLHVEGAADGGVAADGDHRRTDPACAHLDPATTAPNCGLCRLLSNAANSIESAVSQAAVALPPCAAVPTATT